MQFLLGLVETVLGFSAVMLASSLLVMLGIRALHFLANRRATGLAELLGVLHREYRLRIDPIGRPGDVPELTFVSDVLTHAVLGAGVGPRASPSLARTAAAKVESITQEELLLVIEACAQGGLVPETWFFSASSGGRSLHRYKAHVQTWFKTAAGRSTQQFARESKQLAWLFSAIVVAMINLDAFELANAIHRSADGRAALADATAGLLDMADRLAPLPETADGFEVDRDALIQGMGSDLGQLNSLFNIPELELGWTHSRIVRSIHAYRAGRGAASIGAVELAFELGRWLIALGVSVFLVAQGPPFWADLIRSILTRTSARVPRKD